MISWIKYRLKFWRLCRKFSSSKIHKGVRVDSSSFIGRHSVLFSNVALNNTSLGDYSYVQQNSVLLSSKVGKFCSIASNVYIGLVDHPTAMVSVSPVFYDNSQPLPFFYVNDSNSYKTDIPETTISSDVWIGQGVMVKAGVNIGVGAVIGAGSVVTRDIPPYSIAVGSPCRPIKKRFSEEVCERLLRSEWWNLSEAELEELAPTFVDPELFLSTLDERRENF